MEVVSSTTCPHGLPRETCQICRVLEPTPVRAGRPERRRRGGLPANLATLAIVAVVGFVVLGWVAAAFFAVLRILELVAVAVVAGWVGYRLGVHQGRRNR
jgi:Flp pilus assembly protein TadB